MNVAKLAPLASCVLSFLAGVAYAHGFVRTSGGDAGIVADRQDDGLALPDLAASGVTIEPIGIAYVDPDGRGGELVLCRDGRLVRYLEGP